jgi:hypothetical protein
VEMEVITIEKVTKEAKVEARVEGMVETMTTTPSDYKKWIRKKEKRYCRFITYQNMVLSLFSSPFCQYCTKTGTNRCSTAVVRTT